MSDEVFIELTLNVPRNRSLDITPLLDNGLIEKMTGYYEILYEEGLRSDRSVMKLYFPAGYRTGRSEVENLLLSVKLEDYILDEASIEKQNYLEAYKEHYKPLRLSEHFGVIPNWFRSTTEESDFAAQFSRGLTPLYLDPGLAFGTGRHATTQMMVQFIDSETWEGKTILDAGCGSGILALAALKKGAAFATAFDIDGNAVIATRENLRENAILPTRYEIFEGGWQQPLLEERIFDVVLANITMNIFVEYRRVIDRLHCPRLVVSGILEEARDIFLELFSETWLCRGEQTEDGWVLLDLHRK